MKNYFKFKVCFFTAAVFLFFGCPQNKNQIAKQHDKTEDNKIVIKSIKVAGKICGSGGIVESLYPSAKLVAEFEKAYKGLAVTVNGSEAQVTENKAEHTLQNITQAGISVRILVKADGKSNTEFKFTVKLPVPSEIRIDKITLGTEACYHNSIVEVGFDSGLLVVEFLENYENLSVKVNGTAAEIKNNAAHFNLTGISETGKQVNISIEAAEKIKKEIIFTAKKKAPPQTEITAESILIDGLPCKISQIFECGSSSAGMVINFAEAYEQLSVTVNGTSAAVTGKKAEYTLTGITEDKMKVSVIANAKNKNQFTFEFFIKLKPLGKIQIERVLLGTETCTHKGEVLTESETASIMAEFKESYAGLSVTVNGNPAILSGKVASYNVSGITKDGIKITISARADGRIEEKFWFTAKKKENEVPKNDNADLKTLRLVSGTHVFDLDTEFKAATISYTAKAAARYTEFDLQAETADTGATLGPVQKEVSGGNTVLKITVTASDGTTTKTYTVTAEKIPALKSTKRELAEVAFPAGGIEFPVNKDDSKKDRVEKKYSIGKYAVTYELWKEVYDWAAQNGYKFNYSGKAGRDGDGSSSEYPNGSPIPAVLKEESKHQPAVELSWLDAVVWCNAYSVMDGLNALYYYSPKNSSEKEIIKDATAVSDTDALKKCDRAVMRTDAAGYGIPSELQWRLAARMQGTADKGNSVSVVQTDGTVYYFTKGNSASGAASSSEEDTHKVAWFQDDADWTTKPVGGKQPNALGIYDMSGNCCEWLFDGDGAKKRYLLGGHAEQSIDDLCTGAECEKGTESLSRDWYTGLRIVKNEK